MNKACGAKTIAEAGAAPVMSAQVQSNARANSLVRITGRQS
jgi:hypothetical protein